MDKQKLVSIARPNPNGVGIATCGYSKRLQSLECEITGFKCEGTPTLALITYQASNRTLSVLNRAVRFFASHNLNKGF